MPDDLNKDSLIQAVKTPPVMFAIILAPIAYFCDFLPKQNKFILPLSFAVIFLLLVLMSKDKPNRALSLGLATLWGIIAVIALLVGNLH
ncbi:MAG: hypothetical protein KIT34_09720 [Cyanobacteria bacterium TGS_CYA1]|nr:hypothetical protein [Cyanobacteria bacterium TGS_CYA1]